ncbi:bifunctional hydroxymethylpyrimidine kinase/phosphomethylpyrimidine kinase [Sinomonas sp. ASV322]|uniref:bifunctional hydroxymethylpyrimidine kinase/phosphomethylpyrimidine kinase n=1 Tax=Sinomonas sp. ASV322 TaxID=3041920 RepID=UPI0027DCDE51|nr:bifunctional hydroxymethylpyrimidine kinase/phosphomethylpyrimidine kinase [Sinomonas sp. ASV322]MDQ4502341.1 bifunctional hydroxymethylpyrimidine kinase/phosphomethylpyrimidine kinase [Sinomonas sp. ASV322]
MARRIPRVLSIAGSDPSGGAGIQADLKSIAAMGGYGMAAITALTAQNTQGVTGVHTPPASFLRAQLEAVSSDIAIDAVKIGMLADAEVIRTVGEWLAQFRPGVVVLDPVMVATSGDRLLADDAAEALRGLLRQADLVTPNLPELGVLLDEPTAPTWADALAQGVRLSERTGASVLVKGGHLAEAGCPDALVLTDDDGGAPRIVEIPGERVQTRNTHGTGCSLSSAMATMQARTGDWEASLRVVKEWLRGALAASDELEVGSGHGPVHHFHHAEGSVPLADGEFAAGLWDATAKVRAEIDALAFIAQLDTGSLPESQFAYYLAQDAQYLNGFSRALARASALAPTEEEQAFWANSAQVCLIVEAELHRTWLSAHPLPTGEALSLGPVTKAYLDHLLAASSMGSYAVLAAAVLPCYWIYAAVGEELHRRHVARVAANPDAGAHPYGAWIETYADEAFAESTRRAIRYTDRAGRSASAADRAAMADAFRQSTVYERDFFDAPSKYA